LRALRAARFADLAGLARRTLAAARALGRAFENRINQRAAHGSVRHLINGQVEFQKAHRAFDVHADRVGINVRGRREHATDRRAVAGVRVGIEHEIGHARRAAGVERLLETRGVEPGANRVRADYGDGLALIARRGNRTRGADLVWVFCVHLKFLCSTDSKLQIVSFNSFIFKG